MDTRPGNTTLTDSRSQRIRASRGGGQLLTRAHGSWNDIGLPAPTCTSAPVPDGRTIHPQGLFPRGSAADATYFIPGTNVLERLNAEIDRRAKVVGVFPNTAALLRLTTAVLVEQDDEWQDGRRHFSQQSMAQLRADAPALPTSPFLEDLAA